VRKRFCISLDDVGQAPHEGGARPTGHLSPIGRFECTVGCCNGVVDVALAGVGKGSPRLTAEGINRRKPPTRGGFSPGATYEEIVRIGFFVSAGWGHVTRPLGVICDTL
jgi:hypothetical protein